MSAIAAEAFPVGEYLADELEARGWTQADFAEVLDRPAQFVSEVISGKKEITRESATQIAAALGTSAEFWLTLQDRYFLWRQSQDAAATARIEDVRLRARLKELAPVGVMRSRGFITSTEPRQILAELEELGLGGALPLVAKRSDADRPLSQTQLAWAACVRSKGASAAVGEFSDEGLRALAASLARTLKVPADFEGLPARFARVGVRLVYLEAFPSARMDGCSILAGDQVPVIGISGRGKRLDKVLFTILHEAAHLAAGHLSSDRQLIVDEEGMPVGALEDEANSLAAQWVWHSPLSPPPASITRGWVQREAQRHGVAPILVIGRLQREGRVPWRSALVRGAPSVEEVLRSW